MTKHFFSREKKWFKIMACLDKRLKTGIEREPQIKI